MTTDLNLKSSEKIVLTGDRPTGFLHLGHYVGSLVNRIKMQEEYKTFIMIANTQALTDYYSNPDLVRENILNIMEDYLAVGINPSKVTIFIQSEVKALFEMTSYFLNLVTLARAQRNPTVKEELLSKNFQNNIPCGFLCYPISQAADITAFLSDYVPVGKDQLPMIEQTNEIVDKFNSLYKVNVLKKCEPVLSECSKLLGIDGSNKASKSLKNAIFLNDNKAILKEKIFSMYTDPNHIKIKDPGEINGHVVFHYLDIFYSDKDHLLDLKTQYKKGGLGDIFLKELLFDILNEFLDPIRERRSKLDRNSLLDILNHGNKQANLIANKTLFKMREAMCLNF